MGKIMALQARLAYQKASRHNNLDHQVDITMIFMR
jgi:hypothetical protein